jgi:large repetitive protein
VLTAIDSTAAPGSNCPSGSTDPRCTVSVTVLTPALTIVKTANMSTTTPGTTVGYTITVADTGQTPYTGATVTDDLANVLNDAAYNANVAATTGTVSYASPTLTWTGNLTVGATATITYSVTVDNPDTGDKLLSNTVTSNTVGSNCPVGGTAAACTATVQDLIPALTITKTANVANASPGGAVHYTITVTDSGQTPYTGATVTDNLTGVVDDAAYNNDGAATVGTVSYASPTLTWTGNLAVGATVTITYSATVDDPETGDKIMVNTVTSAAPGSTCPSGTANPACSATVAVITGVLSISVPAGAGLGSIATGGTGTAGLGTVTVTDNRALPGASWTATVSSTDFTNTVTPVDLIPAGDASYLIRALTSTTGSATFTPTPVTVLSGSPQAVVTATSANGDNSATWDPQIQVAVPSTAVAGTYTATITHSVS